MCDTRENMKCREICIFECHGGHPSISTPIYIYIHIIHIHMYICVLYFCIYKLLNTYTFLLIYNI